MRCRCDCCGAVTDMFLDMYDPVRRRKRVVWLCAEHMRHINDVVDSMGVD